MTQFAAPLPAGRDNGASVPRDNTRPVLRPQTGARPEHHVTREGRVMVVNEAGAEHLVGWVDHQRNGWRAVRPGGFTVGLALGTRREAVEALMRCVYGEGE